MWFLFLIYAVQMIGSTCSDWDSFLFWIIFYRTAAGKKEKTKTEKANSIDTTGKTKHSDDLFCSVLCKRMYRHSLRIRVEKMKVISTGDARGQNDPEVTSDQRTGSNE